VLPPVTPIAAPPASTAAVADLDARTILTGPSPTPADADADRTVISSSRSRQRWVLTPAGGQAVALSGASAILGRNPTPLDGAQRVVLEDATKTVSKTHARLDLRDGVWTITDLDSTNGVAVTDASGEQLELDSGASAAILAEFHLGELSLRLEVGGS
jgi:hypothetical protein